MCSLFCDPREHIDCSDWRHTRRCQCQGSQTLALSRLFKRSAYSILCIRRSLGANLTSPGVLECIEESPVTDLGVPWLRERRVSREQDQRPRGIGVWAQVCETLVTECLIGVSGNPMIIAELV